MNRRGFFCTLAKAAAGFTILPAATTYSRIWRVQRPPIVQVNPDWYNAFPVWYVMHSGIEPYNRKIESYNRKFLERWELYLKKTSFPPNMGSPFDEIHSR